MSGSSAKQIPNDEQAKHRGESKEKQMNAARRDFFPLKAGHTGREQYGRDEGIKAISIQCQIERRPLSLSASLWEQLQYHTPAATQDSAQFAGDPKIEPRRRRPEMRLGTAICS
jgi:hypothetical protein